MVRRRVVVLALAIAAACGESDEARKQRHAREAEIAAAAEALCVNGTPNAKAAAARVGGKRPIMQVVTRPDDAKVWFPLAWKGLPQPTTIEELQLVVCRVTRKEYATSCSYEGGFTIRKHKATDTLTVFDAKTGRQLGEQRFEGALPSDSCDEAVKVERGAGSRDVTGMPPDQEAETAFLRAYVEG